MQLQKQQKRSGKIHKFFIFQNLIVSAMPISFYLFPPTSKFHQYQLIRLIPIFQSSTSLRFTAIWTAPEIDRYVA